MAGIEVINGFKSAEFSILKSDGTAEENTILVNGNEAKGGTMELKVDGLSGETTTVPASDINFLADTRSVGDLKYTVKMIGVPIEEEMRLIGVSSKVETVEKSAEGDSKTFAVGSDTVVPDVAAVFRSKTMNGKIIAYGFYRAKCSIGDLDLKTIDPGGKKDIEGRELTGTCMSDGRDGEYQEKMYEVGVFTSEAAFEKFRKRILRLPEDTGVTVSAETKNAQSSSETKSNKVK